MTRIGIINAGEDDHATHLARAIAQRGREVCWIDATDFTAESRFSFDGDRALYNDDPLDDVDAFFIRSVMAPFPYVFVADGEYHLYEDWHQDFMTAREKHVFLLSWLMQLGDQGKRLVNRPWLATLNPLKPYQIAVCRRAGIRVPRTLVTNSPQAVRDFKAEVGRVIFKPVVGGAYCQELDDDAMANLDAIARTPVTFQEYIPGDNVRVTALEDRILSACVVSGDEIDFRAGEAFMAGEEPMHEMELPEDARRMVFAAMKAHGLVFTGIDLKVTPAGEFVFLESNHSPAWLHVEAGTGAPITEALVDYLLRLSAVSPR